MDPFPLPLPSEPPIGFIYERAMSDEISTKTAFDTGIKERDMSNDKRRCVVCGLKTSSALQFCHIIPQYDCDSELEIWKTLKELRYIPEVVKSAEHEPRNGMSMCVSHHILFDNYLFYIRYVPETRQYIFINHSKNDDLTKYHGKAILMDADHSHAPFPATFLVHEQRVRGYWPFSRPSPIPPSNPFPKQDWIISDAEDVSAGENGGDEGSHSVAMKKEGSKTMCNLSSSDTTSFALDAETIDKIISASRKSESWKACVQEGTSWEGTAEENIVKYKGNIEI